VCTYVLCAKKFNGKRLVFACVAKKFDVRKKFEEIQKEAANCDLSRQGKHPGRWIGDKRELKLFSTAD
jgi:hypothetical protein